MQVARTKIAALLTCHNRRVQTLACIEDLLSQNRKNVEFEVFLVDDGSTDGTSSAVAKSFPSVHIIHGDGTLYWNGGMRMAMDAASTGNFEFYLWLNDDTRLYPDSVDRLLQTHAQLESGCEAPLIVVGSICDPETGELSYGGSVQQSRWLPLRFSHIAPGSEPQRCDVFNGNCVLLPRSAVELIGNLHPKLVHYAGDYEYGLRAGRQGIAKWIAPGFFGECQTNSLRDSWLDPSVPLRERYKKLFGVKGQPPIPRLIYYSKYGGPLWMAIYPLVYLRPLATSLKRLFVRRK